MTELWQPAHEAHAIAVMAIAMNFADQVPEKLLQRMLRIAGEHAPTLGLQSVLPVQTMNFNPASGMTPMVTGQLFTSIDPPPQLMGLELDFTKQVQVDQNLLLYRTSTYRSWKEELSDFLLFASPIIELMGGVIELAAVRVDYRDLFAYTGQDVAADVGKLLRKESDKLAPGVFRESRPWHSHFGQNLGEKGMPVRIAHTNLDFTEVEGVEGLGQALNIVTGRENRFPFRHLANSDYDANMVRDMLQTMHDELIDLAKDIYTPDIQTRIGLSQK